MTLCVVDHKWTSFHGYEVINKVEDQEAFLVELHLFTLSFVNDHH